MIAKYNYFPYFIYIFIYSVSFLYLTKINYNQKDVPFALVHMYLEVYDYYTPLLSIDDVNLDLIFHYVESYI